MAPKDKPPTTDELLDLIGGNRPKSAKPVEPQQDRKSYREHLLETLDSTNKAHVVMPLDLVNRYREYERNPGSKDYRSEYEDVLSVIKDQGIRQPLWISTDGKTAMLIEGNTRLAAAKELGLQDIPVRVTYDRETRRNEGREPAPLDPVLKKWVHDNHLEGKYGSDSFPDRRIDSAPPARIGFPQPHKREPKKSKTSGPMGINVSDEYDNFTEKILKGWKTVETRDSRSLDPYVGQRVALIQTGVGPAQVVGYVTVGEPTHYKTREEFGAATPQHGIYRGTRYDFKDGSEGKYGYPMINPEPVLPKLVTSKGIVARSVAPEHLREWPKLELPDLNVEMIHLRTKKDWKGVVKELEDQGMTDESSRVRRVLNDAQIGSDRLLLGRNASGRPVAAALVEYGGTKKDPYRIVHQLFKENDAPRHAGSLLMVNAAQEARESNAKLSVRGALHSARTYYRDMGGAFGITVQPEGRRDIGDSSTPRWDTLHRDALADGRPVPTGHWQEFKGKDKNDKRIYRDPNPWKVLPPKDSQDAPQPHFLQPPPEEPRRFMSRKSRSYANPVNREDIKARGGAIDPAYRAAVKDINHRVTEFVRAAYESNPTFLTNHNEIDAITTLVAPAVVAGQMQIAQLTNAQLSKLFGLEHVPAVDGKKYARPGVTKEQELARPFWTAVKAAREGKPVDEALAAGMRRMEKMLATDFQMAKVIQSREVLKASDIQTYARVAGPKACWLCAIAATQTYYTEDLLPIHPGCGCDVVPVPPGGQHSLDTLMDPEHLLSQDASQIKLMTSMVEDNAEPDEYRDLIAVREHGEIGPQLTWAHQSFTGPQDLPVPPSKEVLAQQAYDIVRANGGITIDLAGNQPNDGYAYAPYKTTEFKVAESEFTPKHIDDYVDKHHKQLSRPGNNLGMWTQDGYVYLDVSKVGPPSEATFAKAQAAHQLAVFDLDNFNEINLGTISKTSKEYKPLGTPADLHRQYREQVARRDEVGGAAGVPELVGRKRSPTLESSTAATELTWTGPPVARPRGGMLGKAVDAEWQGAHSFDEHKEDMRSGARIAQGQGYPGVDDETIKDFEYGLAKLPKGANVRNVDELFGQEVVARAVHDDPTEETLWRGITLDKDMYKEMIAPAKVGDTLSMPLSSFDRDPFTAERFSDARAESPWWKSRDAAQGPGAKGIVYELLPGAKVGQVFGEQVTFGQFEVVERKENYVNGATHIVIRQTSMIEEGVTPGHTRKAKADTKIPEVTLIKSDKTPKPGLEATDGKVMVDVGNHLPSGYRQKFEYVPDTTEELRGVRVLMPPNAIDSRAVPGVEQAIRDMKDKYPHIRLDYVGPPMTGKLGRELDKGIGGAYAMTMPTQPHRRNADDLKFASRISLNPKWFGPGEPYDKYIKSMAANSVNGHFHANGHDPAYSTFIHEFGHSVVYEGGEAACKKVNKTLSDLFRQENSDLYKASRKTPEGKQAYKDAFNKWTKSSLSGYSFRSDTSYALDPHEALAEAFADTEMLGDKASSAAKALHNLAVRESFPIPGNGPGDDWWAGGVTQADVDKLKAKAGLKLKPAEAVADKEAKRVAAEEVKKEKAAARAEAKAAKEAAAQAKAAAKAEQDRLEAEKRGPAPGETLKLLPDGKPLPSKEERIAELQKRTPEFVANQQSRYDELTDEEKVHGRRWYADQCTAAANQAIDGKQDYLPIQGVAVNVALSPQTRYDWNTAQGQMYLSQPRDKSHNAIRTMPKIIAPNAMESNASRADRVAGAKNYKEVMAALQEKGDSKKLSNYFPSAWVKGHPEDIPDRTKLFTVDTWAVRTMDHSQQEIREMLKLAPGTRLTERQESRGEQLLSAKRYGTHWEWDKKKEKWVELPNYRSVDMINDDYDVFQMAGVEAAAKAPMFAGTYESRLNEKTGRYETVKTSDEPTPWLPEDYQAALWGQIVPAAPPGGKK